MKLFQKGLVVVAAVALLVGVAVPAANALTTSELVTLLTTLGIDASTAETVAAAVNASGSSSSSSCSFTRDLTVGSTGADVTDLQEILVDGGYLVMPAGVDYGYFGSLTQSAVAAWQAAEGISPASGYFGPISRSYVDCDEEVAEDDEEGSVVIISNDDEADLEEIKIDDVDDLVADSKGQEAFVLTFEADENGGDAVIERIDLGFAITAQSGGEDDLWDIIEAITLEVDGDEVASVDTDDKDDWRNDYDATEDNMFRISSLDILVASGEEVEVSVLLDIADLDEDDDLDLDIELSTVEARYVDGADIIDTVADDGDTASVTVEAMDDVDIDFDESKDNEDDATVSLNADAEFTALVVDMTVEEQDIVVEDVTVTFEIDTDLSAEDIDDLIDDVTLVIDGDEFDAEDINDITASGTSFTVDFDLDDYEIDMDDEIELSIEVMFNELEDDSNFIGAVLNVASVQFEGEDALEEELDETVTVSYAPEMTISAGALVLEDSVVDGYSAFGAASAEVTIELELDGDSEDDGIVVVDTDAFLFDITDPINGSLTDQTVSDLEALGYLITIEDDDNDALGTNFVIDGTEVITIEVTINANDVTDGGGANFGGTGKFELELVAIEWSDWDDASDDDIVDGIPGGAELGATQTLDLSLEADDINLEEQI